MSKKIATVLSFLISAFVAIVFIKTVMPSGSFFNIVTGNSMYPTLLNNQIVFSGYKKNLSRGDIVLLWSYEENCYLIKRIIALPGEHIEIKEDGVYIDDNKLDESYLSYIASVNTYSKENEVDRKLSGTEYFVMGDNRGDSYDSRDFGPVEYEDIVYTQSRKPTSRTLVCGALCMLLFAGFLVLQIFLEKLFSR